MHQQLKGNLYRCVICILISCKRVWGLLQFGVGLHMFHKTVFKFTLRFCIPCALITDINHAAYERPIWHILSHCMETEIISTYVWLG